MIDKKSIYKKIKEKADLKHISIRQLEHNLGFSNGTISKWQDNAPMPKLRDVADYLHENVFDLLYINRRDETVINFYPSDNMFRFKLKQWLGEQYDVIFAKTGVIKIVTPFLDYIDDSIEFYVSFENGKYVVTDDGWYLDEINLFNHDSPQYKEIGVLLERYGILFNHDQELTISCNYDNDLDGLMNNCLTMIQALVSLNAVLVIHK